jgi:hypothetical protein
MPLVCIQGRWVNYDSFSHRVLNLGLHEVIMIVLYRGREHRLLRMGLFDNPSLLVPRVWSIFSIMNLEDPSHQEYIFDFFTWLNNKFKPFLAHVQGVIPDVCQEVNSFLSQRRPGLTLDKILNLLNAHVTGHSLCMIRRISFQLNSPRPNQFRRFSWSNPILGGAMTKLHGNMFIVPLSLARRLGLSVEEAEIRLSNVERIFDIHGQSFRGELLTITASCRFVCCRLLNHEVFRVLCLRRVCSRAFL